jgi:signal transduction histidine kinase
MGFVLAATAVALVGAMAVVAWLIQQRRMLRDEVDGQLGAVQQAATDVAAAALLAARVRRDLDRLVWVTAVDARNPTLAARDELKTWRRSRAEHLHAADRQMLDSAIANTDHAVQLLDQVRSWALAEPAAPDVQLINARAILDDALSTLDHHGNATMDVGALPDVVTDADAMAPVLLEVLSNCLHYRWPGRPVHITVSGSTRDRQATIAIADDGIGIELEDPDLLFLPFARGDGAAAMPGIGLGLARARRTVEALGGTIGFAAHHGRGSTVVITLPTVAPTAPAVRDTRVTVAAI